MISDLASPIETILPLHFIALAGEIIVTRDITVAIVSILNFMQLPFLFELVYVPAPADFYRERT
jgi:hypothetical protein